MLVVNAKGQKKDLPKWVAESLLAKGLATLPQAEKPKRTAKKVEEKTEE